MAGVAMALSSTAKPVKGSDNVMDVTRSITDTAIIFPESFETNTQKMLEGWYMTNYTSTDNRYRTMQDVNVSDEVIITRLQNIPAVVPLPFNSVVRRYIDQYTKHGRSSVAAILGLNNYYLPIFEQALEEENLPLELKYLPMIESGLDPNAVSKHGAAGLWQFTLAAARGFGMEVNSLVDERRDPYLSSQMAAKFLSKLYASYGDWGLVIAAYNCGPGTVNKAIRRAGGDPKKHNFWTIYNYLPAETRGYVPKFIAANYVMNYHKEHNISPVLPTKPLITDTVAVNTRVHFNQISSVLNIPMEELRILNPQFRRDIIPGTPQSTYYLILPSQQIHAYILSEDAIHNYEASKYAVVSTVEPNATPATQPGTTVAQEPVQPVVTAEQEAEVEEVVQSGRKAAPGTKFITHKVGPDESLGSIAKQYGVEPQQIKDWNSLRRNQLRVGQKLLVQVPDGTGKKAAPAQQATAQKTQQAAPATKTAPAQQPAQTTQTAQVKTGKKNNKQTQTASKSSKKDKKASKKKANKKRKKAKPTSYTVKSGDSYERIARKHGVSVNELKKANKAKGDMLHPGDKVKIPAKKATKKSGEKSKKKRR